MSSEPAGTGGGAGGGSAPAEPLLAFADGLLAKEQVEAARGPAETLQYVTFIVSDVEYGIPILQCREIVRVSAITRVPEAPSYVRGVVNLRGHIVPAVDTRQRLGLGSTTPNARSRMIVVEVGGRQIALLVDRVARILKLGAADTEAPAPGAGPPGATAFARVGDATIPLFDAERLLREEAPAEQP
jgi:purine-binding chemotaxis protein CheW